MEYYSVPETDFIDLCGDPYMDTISTTKHLAYFRKPNDGQFPDGTCSIQGHHTLTAVHAGILVNNLSECPSGNLYINWKHIINFTGEQNIQEGEERINIQYTQLQSSRFRLKRNCTSFNPPVWFKIKPNVDAALISVSTHECGNLPGDDNTIFSNLPSFTIRGTGQSVHIKCGQSTNVSPSTSTAPTSITPSSTSSSTPRSSTNIYTETLTPTLSTNMFSSTTMKTSLPGKASDSSSLSSEDVAVTTAVPYSENNTNVPVIVGSVIGGLFLIIIIVVAGFLLLRRKQKSLSGMKSTKATTNEMSSYDELTESNPSYVSVNPNSSEGYQKGEALRGIDTRNYENIATNDDSHNGRIGHEYENMADGVHGSDPPNKNKVLKGQGHTYENSHRNLDGEKSPVYVNEVFEENNKQYSTLGTTGDVTGNYEQLKL